MKRNEVLHKLGFSVPDGKKKRVIVHTDAKNEADDQFAIMHHLLTPDFEIKGIIASHFEWMSRQVEDMISKMSPEQLAAIKESMGDSAGSLQTPRGSSMQASYDEVVKVLELAEIDDIPVYHGSAFEMKDAEDLSMSEGAQCIIDEAMREDDRPLYIAVLGSVTDIAAALKKAPEIAEKMTVIWIAGGAYPNGEHEFNMGQDIHAARIVFESSVELWQIPCDVYRTVEVTLAELHAYVKPCGKIGDYLTTQMVELNEKLGEINNDFPHGESWCLGDNPTVSVLLQGTGRKCWHIQNAPYINDDFTYTPNPNGKEIRVYESVDSRLTLSDFFAKMKLCYQQ